MSFSGAGFSVGDARFLALGIGRVGFALPLESLSTLSLVSAFFRLFFDPTSRDARLADLAVGFFVFGGFGSFSEPLGELCDKNGSPTDVASVCNSLSSD